VLRGSVLVLLLGGCTGTSTHTLDIPDFHATPVPGVRILFQVFLEAPSPDRSRCCRIVTVNSTHRVLYGMSCHLIARDASGHVLFDGPVVDPGPGGLGAAPGRHSMGFLEIGIEHPLRLASSAGSCDEAWDWGTNGPPP
jgi:hypothetical protein